MIEPLPSARSLPGLPGGLPELEARLARRNVPERGRAVVREVFTTDPVRRVRGSGRNMPRRVPSRKMGCVVQCESSTTEGSFVARCEHDPKIRLFLCQPFVLPYDIKDSRGPTRNATTTFDYLVEHEDHGWLFVDCKPESRLAKDDRYVRDGDCWRFPAAEAVTRELGIGIWVYSSQDINPIWQRNVEFLGDFVGVDCPDQALCQRLIARVRAARSIRVSTLLELVEGRSEVLWWLIANQHLAADFERELLLDRDLTWVHDCPERMLAWRARSPDRLDVSAQLAKRAKLVRIEPGSTVRWDGVPWRVVNRGSDKVSMQRADTTDGFVSLPVADVETLLARGALLPDEDALLDEMMEKRAAIVLRASPAALREALRRHRALEYFERHGVPPSAVSRKSITRYQKRASDGMRLYHSAFIGLISLRGRPRGKSRLAPAQRKAVAKAVKRYCEGGRAMSVQAAYAGLKYNWKHPVLPAPSYDTVRRAVNALSRSTVARARSGVRQANQLEGPGPALDYVMPRHGDRAFGVAEMDHSPFDLKLVSSVTGAVLGTAYLSVLIDVFTRVVLAFVLRFGAPRRMPALELLYQCVRIHGRAPDNLVVDGGPEFDSNDFEIALAELGIAKVERKGARPKQGAVMERLFALTNQAMTHQILGNTKLDRLGRGLSASHRPSQFAVWTLPKAYEACREFFFEIYPTLIHGSTGAKPRDVFEHSKAIAGERVARHVVFDLALRALLAETPKTGGPKREVDGSRGVFMRYLRYWHPQFNRDDVTATSVDVKVFPDDCGEILVLVRGEWQRCHIVDGGADLAGRSWRQIQMSIEVLREQHKIGRSRSTQRINAKVIGGFLARLGETEAELAIKRQALLDQENALARAFAPPSTDASQLRLVAVDGKSVPRSDRSASSPASRASQSSADDVECIDFDDLDSLDES